MRTMLWLWCFMLIWPPTLPLRKGKVNLYVPFCFYVFWDLVTTESKNSQVATREGLGEGC